MSVRPERFGLPRALIVALMLLLAGPASAQEPLKELSLVDCYQMAVTQSEEIAIRSELITETEGRFKQALSSILPHVSFISVDKRQDGSGTSAFTRRSLPERRFNFSQPLFSGFKEFAAMRGSKSEKKLREFEKARAEQLLLVDVSDAYHLLLQQREDIRVLDAIRDTLRNRIRELQERERIGRSRTSELVAVQAQLFRVEAEWELSQTQEQVAAQLLEFLTGLDAIAQLKKPGADLPAPQKHEDYLSKAPERPDVKAAEQNVEIARQELKVAKASFFPTVDAEGNYYTKRSGAAEDVKWDVALTVEVPIFQGGKAVGQTQEASSVLRQSQLKLQQAQRIALQDIEDSLAEYDGSLARLRALTKSLEATEENYQLQVEEYRRSLVSNLEVLTTLQTLQDSRRQLIAALYDAHRLYWKLQAAIGERL